MERQTRQRWYFWTTVAMVLGVPVVMIVMHKLDVRDRIQKGATVNRSPAPVRWSIFSPSKAGFSARMPADPVLKVIEKTECGVSFQAYLYASSDAEMYFSIAYYDRPDSPLVDWTPEALLTALGRNVEAAYPGATFHRRAIQVDGQIGAKISVSDTSDGEISQHLLLPAANRCYLLLVSAPRANWNETLAERFLHSFQLQEIAPP